MRRWWFVLAGALLVSAGLYVYWPTLFPAAPTQPPRTATVIRGELLSTVSASGTIQPEDQLMLTFQSAGTIAGVAVAAGDRVVAGQVLATLDTADLELALSQADQAVTVQELTIARLKAAPDANQLAAAQAALAAAQAQLAQSQRGPDKASLEAAANDETLAWNAYLQADTQRNATSDNPFTPLNERDVADAAAGLASVQYQIARHQRALVARGPNAAAIASARVQVAQAQANLNRLKQGAGATDLASAQIQLALARTARDRAKLALARAAVVAPRAGVIGSVNARVGERAPGEKPAFVLVDDAAYHLDLAVDELDVARLSANQPVSVTLDALPGREFPGRITRVATVATSVAGVVSYAVRVDFVAAGATVRTGMTANAVIVTERRPNVLIVPNWSVRIDRGTGQAYVPVRRGGQVVEVPVRLGLRNETASEIVEGLSEGETIEVLADRERLSFLGNR